MDAEKMSALSRLFEGACTALDMRAKAVGFSNVEVCYFKYISYYNQLVPCRYKNIH